MASTQLLLPVIDRATSTIMVYGHDMCGRLMPYGMELFYGLALIMLSWQGVKIMLEQGVLSDVMGELLRSLFFIGFVYWMLGTGTSQGYLDNVITPITGLLDSVADTMASGDGTYSNSIVSGANAMLKMFEIPSKIVDNLLKNSTGWWDTVSIISSNLLLFIIAVIQWALIAVSVAIYIMMAIAGMILLSLAIAVGPLFIPFLLFEPLRNFFSGWFEFFVGACLYKVVAAGFVGIISSTLTSIAGQLMSPDLSGSGIEQSGNLIYTAGNNFMLSIMATAFAALAGYMMLQIPNISRGLLSGSAAANIRGAIPSRKADKPVKEDKTPATPPAAPPAAPGATPKP